MIQLKDCEKNTGYTVGEPFKTTGERRQFFAVGIASLVPQSTLQIVFVLDSPFPPRNIFVRGTGMVRKEDYTTPKINSRYSIWESTVISRL